MDTTGSAAYADHIGKNANKTHAHNIDPEAITAKEWMEFQYASARLLITLELKS